MKAIKPRSQADQKPNAWVVNPKDRGRKSIKKDNKIYLKDGQNFELELFNPLTESVLAEIKVNGKSVSSSGLVLKPGERFYLDCFIDDKKKFVFKTYEVENSEEIKNVISKNGLVEVFFYKEETLKVNNWKTVIHPIVERHYYPVYYPWYQPYWYYYNTPIYGGSLTVGTSNTIYNNGSVTYGGALNNNYTLTSNSSNNLVIGSNLNNSYTTNAFYSNSTPINSSKLETGRVEKGEKSNQQFTEVDINFESYYISSVMYQILPESQKPIETKEIKKLFKIFCENCGNKLKGTENYCPYCSHKQ